ncbi:hypothetical protein VB773_01565 [Haloarculaceae archaeon H-GB2-1]|nr:hypothetical protein [Haloarculaceae archaeon H-GB1-1]MEA5388361.1 hypothetical protein [Haloarculaceae archaeon H-GB11]MEA5406398.1 hypothetical protein [Haloarculaceae archaeon H-GB2-1]
MNRRALLRRLAALGTLSLAGCSGRNSPQAGQATDSTPEPSESTTTASPTPTPSVGESTLTVENVGCGQATNEASVAFDGEATAVAVDGTISGSDTCKRARLRSVAYDASATRLDVVVETFTETVDGETPVCAQCLVDIDYHARVTFADELPESVRVIHRCRGDEKTVATVQRPVSETPSDTPG